MKDFEFILNSDGSGSPLHSGAAACIVESRQRAIRMKLVGFLGPANGNEAELMAGLLGFLALSQVQQTSGGEKIAVRWQTDSQYIVRSMSKAESRKNAEKGPNFGLWSALDECTAAFSIETAHIRARSGNRRNEACDHAARWIQRSGKSLLEKFGEGKIGRMRETMPKEAWILLDLSSLLIQLRNTDAARESAWKKAAEEHLSRYLREFS